ncbi:MAG TPA: DegT/DnrJ/EryC1/StrS family aminotransferase [Solirubrobacteraceae bacterium]|nr:DegT/DnrJ/EryC1/StrS family aminotransferase [Solirubrobacteraceae bacterium]
MTGPAIPANDFAAQWEEVRGDCLEAIDRVGRSGWLVLGEEVRGFERELAAWWGVEHVVGVASGLDALEIGLRCLGIGPGDRVLTTPLTAFATTLAILRIGAEPVWTDVDDSGGLDLAAARAALEGDSSIRALLPVHLYGHPLDLDALRELGEQTEVVVIEDCAQSAGAERGGQPTGTASPVAATSLYPTKNLGAYGDGGALLTGDAEIAERARTLRNYGENGRFNHVEPGLNSRLDELHAAMLRSAMLPRLDRWLERRAAIASRYRAALDGSRMQPVQPTGGRSAHHLFPVVVDGDAADARRHLSNAGIGVGRHYPVLCPDQPACDGVGTRLEDMHNARRIAELGISLPIHPQLGDADVERVVEACVAWCDAA